MRAIRTSDAAIIALLLGAILLAALLLTGVRGGSSLSGEYHEVGGSGKLEFRGGRVYITALMGMTFTAPYEVDGDHIVIRGASGTQVYIRRGDTLDAGMGMRFVKKGDAPSRAAAEE